MPRAAGKRSMTLMSCCRTACTQAVQARQKQRTHLHVPSARGHVQRRVAATAVGCVGRHAKRQQRLHQLRGVRSAARGRVQVRVAVRVLAPSGASTAVVVQQQMSAGR